MIIIYFNTASTIYEFVLLIFSGFGDFYEELSDSVHYMNINAETKNVPNQHQNWTGTKKYVFNENAFCILKIFGDTFFLIYCLVLAYYLLINYEYYIVCSK